MIPDEVNDEVKDEIDSLSKDELREEIEKGRVSRFHRKKFAYVKSRYKMLCEQEDTKTRQQDIEHKEAQLDLASEANQISRDANRRSTIAIVVAALALLVTLGRLVLDLFK